MDKHLEALQLFRAKHIFDGEIAEALDAAIALMRGQSEPVAWQVRVYHQHQGRPHLDKWSKWQDIEQDRYEAAKREGYYYEYTTIELRALVPKQEPAE